MWSNWIDWRQTRGLLSATWLVLSLVACAKPLPEQRIRDQIDMLQAALEARHTQQFMAAVADDFIGDTGLDKSGLRNILRAQFLRHQDVGIRLGPVDIEIQGTRATARFSVMATGGQGGWIPDSARPWAVTTGWREEKGEWLLIQAAWTPVL